MMTKNRGGGTRLHPGDVLAAQADGQKWLLCYCGRDASLGDTVWIRSGAVPLDQPIDCASFEGEGYFAFYPATAAVRSGLVTREGFCTEGMHIMPPLRRISSPFSRKGEPTVWKIAADADVGTPFTLRTRLTRAEARIPQGAIWNHEFLLDRLRSGWHPTLESDAHPDL